MSRRQLVLILFSVFFATVFTAGCSRQEKPVSVLIIDGQNNHAWERTTPELQKILESSGRFTVDVLTSPAAGEDLSGFRAPFSGYDVVLSNYNGDLWPEEMQRDFEEYVRSGGGFVVFHAADNAFPEWEAYNEMIGLGGWGDRDERSGPYIRVRDGQIVRDNTPGRGGSHGARHAYVVDVFAPDHPIMQGIPPRWRHVEDELYDRLRGPAKNLEVLATAYSDTATGGSGEHEPVLMTITYGEGRIFHTVLGHDVEQMQGVGFQTTLLRGTEWAATGRVTIPVPEDFPAVESVERETS